MNAIVRVRNVVRAYEGKVRALDDVTLDIRRGEAIAVMGASGSGKTTLLNLLSGLDRPTSGSVEVEGIDLASLSRSELARYRREKVGLVFQQFHLVRYLTALENVMLAQHFHSLVDRAEALALLERVGMGPRATHLPSELSGGEQQRVCIARALVNRAPIILADEPTGNLDADNEKKVLELLKSFHDEGHTIVVVTHDPLVGMRADRRVYLQHGRLVEPPAAAARPAPVTDSPISR